MDDNSEKPELSRQAPMKLIDWFFIPLPAFFVVMGIGILSGLMFKDNFMLQGPTKLIIGLLCVIYGSVRLIMLSRKLLMVKRERNG
jgi:hypothetical protein